MMMSDDGRKGKATKNDAGQLFSHLLGIQTALYIHLFMNKYSYIHVAYDTLRAKRAFPALFLSLRARVLRFLSTSIRRAH